jgi:hypothetical protein
MILIFGRVKSGESLAIFTSWFIQLNRLRMFVLSKMCGWIAGILDFFCWGWNRKFNSIFTGISSMFWKQINKTFCDILVIGFVSMFNHIYSFLIRHKKWTSCPTTKKNHKLRTITIMLKPSANKSCNFINSIKTHKIN